MLPARVVAVDGDEAEIELHGGQRVRVSTALQPEVQPGAFVLVDRGLVLEVIESAEAEAILSMYAEFGDLPDPGASVA